MDNMNTSVQNEMQRFAQERNEVGAARDARHKAVLAGAPYSEHSKRLRDDAEYQELRDRYAQVDRAYSSRRRVFAQSLTVDDVIELVQEYAINMESKGKLDTVGGFRDHVARHFGVEDADIVGVTKSAVSRLLGSGALLQFKADKAPGGRPHSVPGTSWVYGTPAHVANIAAAREAKADAAARQKEMDEAAYDRIVSALGADASSLESITEFVIAAARHAEVLRKHT